MPRLDLIHIASCIKTDNSKKIEVGKGEVMRFEFLEAIVRMAHMVYEHELTEEDAITKLNYKGEIRY